MSEDYQNDYDVSESVWKIDGPIGRKSYLWVNIGLILLLIPIFLLKISGLLMFLFPVALILALIMIWISYAATAKRFCDIAGSLKAGVLIAVVVFLLNFVFKPITLIALIVGLLMPGKFIK